jgi:hypothetical protein
MRIRAFAFSLAVAAPCIFSIWKGIELTGFSLLSADARSLAGWSDINGLRYEALASRVALKSVSGPPVEFEGVKPDVVALLSARPMAGNFWMFLADGELLSGEPVEHVLSVFEMAVLTTPREGVNMSRRVDFAIRIWEFLPVAVRERVASDFNAVRPLLTARELQRLKTIVTAKQDGVRADLRTRLAQRAGVDAAWFSQIGL